MRALRALPTLMRVGVSQAVAYRAEMLVWVLTTTMPLIMLPLWHAVAEEVDHNVMQHRHLPGITSVDCEAVKEPGAAGPD